MTSQNNPWAERFVSLLDREEIRRRATVTVPPLLDLNALPIETACSDLKLALRTLFVPTSQCLDNLLRWVGLAYAHCLAFYPDSRSFLSGVYSKDAPLSELSYPICLTGLGGTGKSHLIKAFRRIMVEDFQQTVSADHSEFLFKALWSIQVNDRRSFNEMLMTLAEIGDAPRDLVAACRRRAYRNGVAFVLADEFQFATQSSNANALVTRMLLSLAFLGLPFVYVANFSLLNRLLKRPQEDQDRLLADPVVFLPDEPNSDDWNNTLAAQKSVAPEIFVFNETADGEALHRYSVGIKRAEVKLLVIAYRIAREMGGCGKVALHEIELAYRSTEYAFYRRNVEAITRQIIQNKKEKGRDDLWCPIDLPVSRQAAFTEQVKKERSERVSEAIFRSAMTAKEKKLVDALQSSSTPKAKKAPVLKLSRKKLLTADELKNNANWYRDQI